MDNITALVAWQPIHPVSNCILPACNHLAMVSFLLLCFFFLSFPYSLVFFSFFFLSRSAKSGEPKLNMPWKHCKPLTCHRELSCLQHDKCMWAIILLLLFFLFFWPPTSTATYSYFTPKEHHLLTAFSVPISLIDLFILSWWANRFTWYSPDNRLRYPATLQCFYQLSKLR